MTAPPIRVPSSAEDSGHPFSCFWMGGYEGADHVNGLGVALDMAWGNGHVEQLEADHARAAALGIRTVRETIGWRLAETGPGRFDLGRALRIADSANRHGLQVLWTLMHYGTPADVSLLEDTAIDRFAAFAAVVANTLGPLTDQPPVYNLVNEISFLAWAVSHTNMVHPYRNDPRGVLDLPDPLDRRDPHELCEPGDRREPGDPRDVVEGTAASGYDVKRRLARMALAAIDKVRAIDPRARFLHVEPLVHVVAPRGRPELAELAEQISGYQWQAWDMLCGRAEPELGGDIHALDLIGINHYHSSQWEAATEDRLWWHLRDARRRPFAGLLQTAWERYRRPMIVAETSHFGEGRAQWLNELASEVEVARGVGLPVHGICLYPLIDRPDWSNPAQWHHSGLWDVAPAATGDAPAQRWTDHEAPAQRRVLCGDYAAVLQRWQARLPNASGAPSAKPLLVVFSHLRWGFVHHRPQQLLTRLADCFHILFVEEPLALRFDGEPARLDCISHGPHIEVLLPRTALDDPAFSEAQLATIAPLLEAFLASRGIGAGGTGGEGGAGCIAWFYTPMAEPLLATLPARFVVYDCIDEMSAFANSSPELPTRESALLRAADLVLTSGPALQRAKAPLHPQAHCVANGVAAGDFAASALDAGSAQAAEAAKRQGLHPGPRLGYSGVVDERIDLKLIETIALAHPEWQIVMAGPVVKIDPTSLPKAPNIRWLGFQPYVRLPYLLASWDVCLIPFADQPITRFVNPVKTLEYLAAGKPVVATALPDIVELYAEAVEVASDRAAFLAACERAVTRRAAAWRESAGDAQRLVDAASWDSRVDTILGLLEQRGAFAALGVSRPTVQAR